MKTKPHTCPSCGQKLPLSKYINLPGDYSIKCPHCGSILQPELSDFHRILPWIIGIVVILIAMNRKSGLTGFLILIGLLTFIAYIFLMAGAYLFIRMRKSESEEE